jgi:hypothetical protein
MGDTAAPDSVSTELDALIETNNDILEQIRKDLSQEYTRFMSRLLKERLGIREGGGASIFEHLGNAPPLPSSKGGTS